MPNLSKICVAMIAGTHGVRGLVKLRSFTEDPGAIVDYMPLTDETGGRVFEIELKSTNNDHFIAAIDGVDSKEAADALRGTKLYASRDILPKATKREYYNADLMGLAVVDAEGKNYGTILGVYNFGGGPMLEIGTSSRNSFMLPFNDSYVPDVDVVGSKVTVVVPEGWLKNEKPDPEEARTAPKKKKNMGKKPAQVIGDKDA